jgi:hypothetical protein
MPVANTHSWPQLEAAEPVTVYLFFPVEQLVTLSKTPTDELGAAVVVGVLKRGVSTIAQPVDPPPPPPPPFPFCANSGNATNTTQTNTNVSLTKRFFIRPPRRIELS